MHCSSFSLELLAGAMLGAFSASCEAQAPAESCQSYTRTSTGAPEVVGAWLSHSSDEHVLVCAQPALHGQTEETVYFGESAVARRGAVCSYSSHGLTRIGAVGTSHLASYERGEALEMALASGDCPPPSPPSVPGPYTATYELTPSAFVAIMRFWAAAASSAEGFEHGLGKGSAPAEAETDTATSLGARERLRAAIAAGKIQSAAVRRIVRISGFGLHHRYALFVADPDSRPPGSTLYVIYLSHWLSRPYRITGIADTAD